jgi:CDP-diglyceride synthetase
VPANDKVSVGWQIVFQFLPVVNFWAFYRIRKLRKFVLYIILPQVVVLVINAWYTYRALYSFMGINPHSPIETYLAWAAAFVLQAVTVYLVIIWSRQHNRQFDQPTSQSAAPAA